MKSYDDLQRFKEKTQTSAIEFKDMSEETLQAGTTKWAIIKQLLDDDHRDSVLHNGQSIDVAVPQPVEGKPFSQSDVDQKHRQPPSSGGEIHHGSLFSSVAATLTPATAAAESQAVPPLKASSPAPASSPMPAADPAGGRETSRIFSSTGPHRSSLFHRRQSGQEHVITKDTLLRPLLEKIALCR